MIERESGDRYEVECDSCDEEMTVLTDSFMDCVDTVEDLGWMIFREDGEWCHYCPSCSISY